MSVAALVRDYLDSFVQDAGDDGDPSEETEIVRRRGCWQRDLLTSRSR